MILWIVVILAHYPSLLINIECSYTLYFFITSNTFHKPAHKGQDDVFVDAVILEKVEGLMKRLTVQKQVNPLPPKK